MMGNKPGYTVLSGRKNSHGRAVKRSLLALLACTVFTLPAHAQSNARTLLVPVHRSSLVTLPAAMTEVMVAAPDIADVHAHNANNLTVVGKKMGRTTIRVFGKEGKLEREFEVVVGHDLPAIRRALKNFLPDETIGVEMLNTSIALTGNISSAAAADKAVKIARDFVGAGTAASPAATANPLAG